MSDTGIGIADDEQADLFSRFYRTKAATKGEIPGTGLGLYISRELARRHGGTLELEDLPPEQGSLFTLKLPVAHTREPIGNGNGNGRPRLRLHRGGGEAPAPSGQIARRSDAGTPLPPH